MNCSRVCTFEFGKSPSAFSSAAAFASVSPPFILRNEKRSFGCGFSASQASAEIVTGPNGEPPVGGSKMPFTVNVRFVAPVTKVTGISEPSDRLWSSA